MSIRVTTLSLYQHSQSNIASSYARFALAQSQISSGRRITVFSDDPASAARVLDIKATLARTIESRESLVSARHAADLQASVLQEISGFLIEARGHCEDAASGTKSESDLAAIAVEIDSILSQILGGANQQLEGRFLFAGSNIDSVPFQTSLAFGSITGVTYTGDDITRKVRLGPAELKDVDLSGEDAFLTFRRGSTSIAGSNGLAAAGTSLDTMVGDARLIVSHTATNYGDGLGPGGGDSVSGIGPGASSAADTIIGPPGSHQLKVSTGANGETLVTLDGGEAVKVDGTETDLQLTNGLGETVHLDLTGLTPGFQGNVDLGGDGTIQVEGGPVQALTFTGDYLLEDAEGRVVHLDTTGLHGTGDSLAVFPGTESVFDVLIGLRDEILSETGFSSDDLVKRIQGRMTALDRSHQGILTALSTLGARSSSFESIEQSLSGFELSLQEKRGQLEDTDIFAASLELAQSENAYQAALLAAAKLNGPSLMDFL